MPDVMLVTVGTSLFHSASWKFDGWMSNQIQGYDNWNMEQSSGDPGPLISPEKRIQSGVEILAPLKEKLLSDPDAEEMAPHFETEIKNEHVMRYSAEFATIFKLVMKHFDEDIPRGLLENFKDNIWFIADPDPVGQNPNLQFVAATHLKKYLNHLASGLGADILRIRGLSSGAANKFLDKKGKTGIIALYYEVEKLLNGLGPDSKLYWIASAGYKIYGVLLGTLLCSPNSVVVYQHEDSRLFMELTKEKIFVGSGNPGSENSDEITERPKPVTHEPNPTMED